MTSGEPVNKHEFREADSTWELAWALMQRTLVSSPQICPACLQPSHGAGTEAHDSASPGPCHFRAGAWPARSHY